jgi:hypothetical protein
VLLLILTVIIFPIPVTITAFTAPIATTTVAATVAVFLQILTLERIRGLRSLILRARTLGVMAIAGLGM